MAAWKGAGGCWVAAHPVAGPRQVVVEVAAAEIRAVP